jgi:hypothetical protein
VTPDARTALRPGLARIIVADLDTESKIDALVGFFERLLPAAEPTPEPPTKPEMSKIVGVAYIANRLGLKRARAYAIAATLPGRVDVGDSRLRFSQNVLDAHFANGGEAVATPARKRRRS